MDVAAAVALFLTVSAGAVVLGYWAHPERATADRRSVGLASAHVAAATTAVAAWVVYLIGGSNGIGSASLVALLAAAALGGSTLLSTRQRERSGRYVDRPEPVPTAVLAVHAAAAATAVTLSVLALVQR